MKRRTNSQPAQSKKQRKAATRRLPLQDESPKDETSKQATAKPKQAAQTNSLQGQAVNLPPVVPWHNPVNGADVLGETADTIARYIVIPPESADAVALWCAHTHVYKLFQCSPRLNISAPDKGCGKTTLRDVLGLLVPRPVLAENLTTAVLFRLAAALHPTILADEYDSWIKNSEDLRGLFNSGYRRGGKVFRCVGTDNEVRSFEAYCPAALCGIGALPGTLHDRSIVIGLERAKPGELRERFDSLRTARENEICQKLARWCQDSTSRLASCEPTLPAGAFNRLADNWRPLFAVADVAGGDWPARAAIAFEKLNRREDVGEQGAGVVLLADIRDVFADTNLTRIPSAELCEKLITIEGKPWAEFGRHGFAITPNQLAKLLKRFKIHPRNIKLETGKVPKGYYAEDFKDAFERYLPAPGESNRYSATEAENKGDSESSQPLPAETGSGLQNQQNLNEDGAGSAVADKKRG